ncbi:MAG: 30S ribosomal protein S8 [Gammaproteobacteria bacterium]
MSMSDPIACMLTCIRNAQNAGHPDVKMPGSKVKGQIAKVLQDEGYITSYELKKEPNNKSTLSVKLKYYEGKGVIEEITRISKPGLRRYLGVDDLPKVRGGLGIYIVSTSKGLVTDHQARKLGQGGEVICAVA